MKCLSIWMATAMPVFRGYSHPKRTALSRAHSLSKPTFETLVKHFLMREHVFPDYRTNFVREDLAGFDFTAAAPTEISRKISQNLSPAGVTSPFEARAMPTDATSVVPPHADRRLAQQRIRTALQFYGKEVILKPNIIALRSDFLKAIAGTKLTASSRPLRFCHGVRSSTPSVRSDR